MRRILFTLCLLSMTMWISGACGSEDTASNDGDTASNDGGSGDTSSYNELTAGLLAPTGCETFIGAHPSFPDELYCCSAPSAGSAPACAPGDKPDIPCVVKYEFCDDGTAKKAYSPNPETGYPGHTISKNGSWTIDSNTGELKIITKESAMNGTMITDTTETYPYAFTYDGGTKLDLHSSAAVTIDAAGIGEYHRDASHNSIISGLWGATLDIDMNTDVTVTATGYESTLAQKVDCAPPMGMVCQVVPNPDDEISSGTHTLPIDLYITPTGTKMYQSETVKALVFERQPDPCDEIECGEHGSCKDGACVCTHGYTGEFCDEAGLCVGIECAENATCVEGICECDAGYEGDSCEVDINECDPNPCMNGGSCAEGVPGAYECSCIGGYTGNNCERCPNDADGDGYGYPASALCTHPELDCDDNNPTVYPGSPELCDGLDNQCPGDTGYGSVDEGYGACADMVPIPSGCFNMGDAFADGWPDELPVHEVCLSAFEMDRHEITNAEYAECVGDGRCTAPKSSNSYSRVTYYGDSAYNNYPVIWMEWHQVEEFCAWAGKRLPTEAEWEYAARGGLAGKRYPWGDTISSTDANYDMNIGDTTEVESYAANGYGLYDMAGNVWEWVADWFDENYYSVSPTNDPTGSANGLHHVKRGGSFDHSTFGLRAANRCDFCHADRHGNNLGGRCAR